MAKDHLCIFNIDEWCAVIDPHNDEAWSALTMNIGALITTDLEELETLMFSWSRAVINDHFIGSVVESGPCTSHTEPAMEKLLKCCTAALKTIEVSQLVSKENPLTAEV